MLPLNNEQGLLFFIQGKSLLKRWTLMLKKNIGTHEEKQNLSKESEHCTVKIPVINDV